MRSIVCDQDYAIHLLCISETLGDIAVTYEIPKSGQNTDQSELRVYTVNARAVGSVLSRRRITALCYSNAPEGVSVNVIATGLDNGVIRYSAYVIFLYPKLLNLSYLTKIYCSRIDYGAVGTCSWLENFRIR